VKLIDAINEAKRRAFTNVRSGYSAHPTYDVWAHCIVAFNGPRFSIDVTERNDKFRRRLYMREWQAIVDGEG
jgi:enolase